MRRERDFDVFDTSNKEDMVEMIRLMLLEGAVAEADGIEISMSGGLKAARWRMRCTRCDATVDELLDSKRLEYLDLMRFAGTHSKCRES